MSSDAAFREAVDALIQAAGEAGGQTVSDAGLVDGAVMRRLRAAEAHVLALYAERDERVTAISALKDGWDSYWGKAPTEAAIKTARVMASVPSVVPTNMGGVQFEWHRNGVDVEIEIAPDGTIADAERQGEEGVVVAHIPTGGWPEVVVRLRKDLGCQDGDRVRVTKVEEGR